MSRTPWHRHGPRPASITQARTGLTQDVRARQRRYLAAMLVRSACVVVMAATWNRWPALALCALAGAFLIPYVAVVAAQAGWRQQRGDRPALTPVPEEPAAARVPLEPTLILPPEHHTAA
ncbi:DUF3099 domain-containing protein [Streptomyces sp. NBC_00080]|uniref:DUF3099 domain-containing protein n=1 Tax=unclassified Streptomyces TaxID=2593676 RepID=UPI00114F6E35|nr:DUF3099 domain-containing protein [Streptomyces sp. SLBN-115]TQJ37103.1 DUF3099 family protein [Streptomyces sp. SLBN-115]